MSVRFTVPDGTKPSACCSRRPGQTGKDFPWTSESPAGSWWLLSTNGWMLSALPIVVHDGEPRKGLGVPLVLADAAAAALKPMERRAKMERSLIAEGSTVSLAQRRGDNPPEVCRVEPARDEPVPDVFMCVPRHPPSRRIVINAEYLAAVAMALGSADVMLDSRDDISGSSGSSGSCAQFPVVVRPANAKDTRFGMVMPLTHEPSDWKPVL
mgnify:FL=1